MMIGLFCISIGLAGLIVVVMVIIGSVVLTVEGFLYYYMTAGLPMSLFGYKATRKYYDNKEKIKQLFSWKNF